MGQVPGLVWLHIISDLLIWLAYLSIPIVLASFVWRRRSMPFHGLILLFGLFILSCGTSHLVEAITFRVPIYGVHAVVKVVTAVVSWAAVIALAPAIPRALALRWDLDTGEFPVLRPGQSRVLNWHGYALALLLLAAAVGIRWSFLTAGEDRVLYLPFIVALIFAAWYGGVGPALVTILGGVAANGGLTATGPSTLVGQIFGLGFFVFAGITIAFLAEAQHAAHGRARQGIFDLQGKRRQLEAEIERRREVERKLRLREQELIRQADELAEVQKQTSLSLALIDTFVMKAPVGMAFLDPGLRFVRVNQVLADYHGRPIDVHLGRPVAEVLPELPPVVLDDLRTVLDSGRPLTDRIYTIPADRGLPRPGSAPGDRDRTYLNSFYPVRDPGGATLGVGVVATDVTERLAAESRIRDSEERFRTLAEVVPQMVWMTDAAGLVEYMNHRWLDYTGQSEAEVAGRGWLRALHPDDAPAVAERWRVAVESDTPYEAEYRMRGSDGSYRWSLARGIPLRDAHGRIVRWFGTTTDVHDSRIAQEALRRSEERFRGLALNVPQMVWVTDAEGRVEEYNRRWYDYTGLPPDSSRGDGWGEIVHPDDFEPTSRAWRRSLATGEPFETEQRLRRHDGQFRWHLARGVALRDSATGRINQWIGTTTDIEDQKQQSATLERLVRERTAELERSNRELEEFAYVASHDLQEPLRKIQSFNDRLMTRCRDALDDQGRDYLDRIQKSAGRMRQLITDLLGYSRVATQKVPPATVDLGDVAREVVADLESLLQASGGRVEVHELPSIEADPTQIRQLLENLIVNALKFRRPDVPPVVHLRSRVLAPEEAPPEPFARDWVEIEVEDNGIGFDTMYLDRIFQVFQRLHGRDRYEGTGVGLAICRKIVERHGGVITARSQPDQGAAFLIRLPLLQPPERD